MSKIKITGPWDMQKIESYLDTCVVPLKLAIISARGWPVIASLWFFTSLLIVLRSLITPVEVSESVKIPAFIVLLV